MKRPAVFLDRDGVIIENRADYVRSWEDVAFLPGCGAAIRRLNEAGFVVVVVTNQSAVGRGLMSLDTARVINEGVTREMSAQGAQLDAVYMCPHHPGDLCPCRKPNPGLLLTAAHELDLDLSRSYLVGDALTDMEAARKAGVSGILVRTGRGEDQLMLVTNQEPPGFAVVRDLQEAALHIVKGRRDSCASSSPARPVI